MYNPPHFREERVDVLHELIRRHPLSTLVTLGSDGLTANHIPLILEPEPAPFGTLRGHVSRANPLWRAQSDALAIFQGPDAYITPTWYPTKRESGRVVPTWNYVVVHAHGAIHTFEAPDWLLSHVRNLVHSQESELPLPWRVEDAPSDFIAGQLKGIVGIEIPIVRLEGKWKVSQNRSAEDRAGVVSGLSSTSDPNNQAMAGLVSAKNQQK
jgi:transcriptional regulator